MPAHILNMGGHCPPIMATLTPMAPFVFNQTDFSDIKISEKSVK